MKRETQIEVLMVEPGKRPYRTTIDDTLEAMQQKVGGLIECIVLDQRESVLVCNDEGKLIGTGRQPQIGAAILSPARFLLQAMMGKHFNHCQKKNWNNMKNNLKPQKPLLLKKYKPPAGECILFSFDSY